MPSSETHHTRKPLLPFCSSCVATFCSCAAVSLLDINNLTTGLGHWEQKNPAVLNVCFLARGARHLGWTVLLRIEIKKVPFPISDLKNAENRFSAFLVPLLTRMKLIAPVYHAFPPQPVTAISSCNSGVRPSRSGRYARFTSSLPTL